MTAFVRPDDLDAVTRALAGAEAPVVLGGGTVLVPDLTYRKVRPDLVVDVSHARLGGVEVGGGTVRLGAGATYADVLATTDPAPCLALLRTLSGGITGGPQIRGRATLVGSAAYANPSSDVPAALVALRGDLRLASVRGTRTVAAADFFTGAFTTARERDEVVTAVDLPVADEHHGYVKLKLSESSWPIVTAACLVDPEGRARVVLGGLATVPVCVAVPAEALDAAGGADDRELAALLTAPVTAAVDEPWDDVLADGAYRLRVAPVVAARALRRSLATTTGGQR